MRSTVSILILLSVTAMVQGCRLHESEVTVESVLAQDVPDQESWSPVLRVTENGQPRMTITAGYMARYDAADSVYMHLTALDNQSERVRVELFDDQGGLNATIQANEVIYFESERRFTARGEVVVDSRGDRHLESEHLAWSEETERVTTPGFATITTPSRIMSGWGLDADENLNDLSLTRVRGVVSPDEEDAE